MTSQTQKTILVVEDDDDIRTSLQEILESLGYNVACARNGKEALECLANSKPLPSLVLLDLMMPVMSGYEFLKRKEVEQSISHVPVVIVSAIVDQSQIPADHVKTYIKKPIDIDRLVEAIEQFSLA